MKKLYLILSVAVLVILLGACQASAAVIAPMKLPIVKQYRATIPGTMYQNVPVPMIGHLKSDYLTRFPSAVTNRIPGIPSVRVGAGGTGTGGTGTGAGAGGAGGAAGGSAWDFRNATLFDDFGNNTINTALWDVISAGSGPEVAVQGGRLEVTIPAGSKETTSGVFAAGLISRFRLTGDFDIQVDYALLDWPPVNGVRTGIIASVEPGTYGPMAVERASDAHVTFVSGTEFYVADFELQEGLGTFVPTGDGSGALRLGRTGTEWSAYYYSGGRWLRFYSIPRGTTEDVYVCLAAWSHDYTFAGKDVTVALDNFIINKGQIIHPI